MKEKFLDEKQTESLFAAGFKSAMSEKRAGVFKDFLALGGDGVKMLRNLGIYGIAAGALGGLGYNLTKDYVTDIDPKEKFHMKVQSMLADRDREIEDAKWMKRVRNMRNELIVGGKKMNPEEYSRKYKALVDALDERKA